MGADRDICKVVARAGEVEILVEPAGRIMAFFPDAMG